MFSGLRCLVSNLTLIFVSLQAVAYFFEHGIGTGMPPDQKEAVKWYEMAAKKGDKGALKKVQELGGKTSRFSMIWPSSFSISASVSSSRAPSTMSSARSSMYSISNSQAAQNALANMTSPMSVVETPMTTMSAMGVAPSPMNSKPASVASMPVDSKKPPKQKKGRKACLIQ